MDEIGAVLFALGIPAVLIWLGYSCGSDVARQDAVRCHRQFATAGTTADSLDVVFRNEDCRYYLQATRDSI